MHKSTFLPLQHAATFIFSVDSGLGINMKSVGSKWLAPPRLEDNYDNEDKPGSYALYQTYPRTAQALRDAIQAAFDRRGTRTPINTRDLFKNNRRCP